MGTTVALCKLIAQKMDVLCQGVSKSSVYNCHMNYTNHSLLACVHSQLDKRNANLILNYGLGEAVQRHCLEAFCLSS